MDSPSLPLCIRTPNIMPDVMVFLAACKTENHPYNAYKHKLFLTDAGSINENGIEGSFTAPSLTPFHTQFEESLEPAIRPLVSALFDFGCFPYTSCEGHDINGRIYEAHVGLLLEQCKTYNQCLEQLQSISQHGLVLFTHQLWDPNASQDYETIEIYITHKSSEYYSDYRAKVLKVVEMACHALRRGCG
ncbi:MAG: hypothetical protein IM542_10215 [Pseudanabaena sp. M165S2SP1A06QC]|nr:hypothetical protein [Pseudanabaena sp. M165S2SP1A06QC]